MVSTPVWIQEYSNAVTPGTVDTPGSKVRSVNLRHMTPLKDNVRITVPCTFFEAI